MLNILAILKCNNLLHKTDQCERCTKLRSYRIAAIQYGTSHYKSVSITNDEKEICWSSSVEDSLRGKRPHLAGKKVRFTSIIFKHLLRQKITFERFLLETSCAFLASHGQFWLFVKTKKIAKIFTLKIFFPFSKRLGPLFALKWSVLSQKFTLLCQMFDFLLIAIILGLFGL